VGGPLQPSIESIKYTCDDEHMYYLDDANFNVTVLVNTSVTVVERYEYDPYGKVRFLDSSWGSRQSSSYDNEILYCGYRYDPETGLYHVRERMYHPTLGRWLQRDPLGYVDGMSLYEYVGSNPMAYSDSLGTATKEVDAWATEVARLLDEAKRVLDEDEGGALRAKELRRTAGLLMEAISYRLMQTKEKDERLKQIWLKWEELYRRQLVMALNKQGRGILGINRKCCGKELYDPRTHACCKDNVVRSRKEIRETIEKIIRIESDIGAAWAAYGTGLGSGVGGAVIIIGEVAWWGVTVPLGVICEPIMHWKEGKPWGSYYGKLPEVGRALLVFPLIEDWQKEQEKKIAELRKNIEECI